MKLIVGSFTLVIVFAAALWLVRVGGAREDTLRPSAPRATAEPRELHVALEQRTGLQAKESPLEAGQAQLPPQGLDRGGVVMPDQTENYLRDAGLILETFLGEEPDLARWSSLWGQLAADAELQVDSLHEQDGMLLGEFKIANTDMTITFEAGTEGYTLIWNDDAAVGHEGFVDFRSTVAFVRDDPAEVHGSVHFTPREGQHFHEQGPMGYLYTSSDSGATCRPLVGSVNGHGALTLSIPLPETARAVPPGDLGSAYQWRQKLDEAERSR